jgi:hypothetical protein
MTVHLVKLCVGIERLQDLRLWQAKRLDDLTRAGQLPELCHKTKQMPRRKDEVLDGGSLYWVIKGYVSARQRIVDLKETVREDGSPCCGIVLDPAIVETGPIRAVRSRGGVTWSPTRRRRTSRRRTTRLPTCRRVCARSSAPYG